MKTSTWFSIVAVVLIGGLVLVQQYVIAVIAAAFLGLLWRTHILEVKINRLLDAAGLFVSQRDLEK
jgi:hypothetical protein